jgi:hypothetical protein
MGPLKQEELAQLSESTKQTIAQIAATLMSAGQLGINDLDAAVAKAVEIAKKSGLVK